MRITEKNYEPIKNVHLNWYHLWLKALIAQMGKQLYGDLSRDDKRRLAWCLDQIDDKHDLVYAARCLVQAKRRQMLTRRKQGSYQKRKTKNSPKMKESIHQKWIGGFLINDVPKEKLSWKRIAVSKGKPAKNPSYRIIQERIDGYQKNIKSDQRQSLDEYHPPKTEHFIRKKIRRLPPKTRFYQTTSLASTISYQPEGLYVFEKTRKVYKNRRPHHRLQQTPNTPLTNPLKQVPWYFKYRKSNFYPTKKTYKEAMYSNRFEKYRFRARRAKRDLHRLIDPEFTFHNDKYTPEITMKSMSSLDKLSYQSERSPVARFADFLRNIIGSGKKQDETVEESMDMEDLPGGKWPKTMESLKKISKEMDEKNRMPGTKPYKFRMYDIVMGNDEPTLSPTERKGPAGLIQQGMNLMRSLKGLPKKDRGNVRFLSPRFLSLMPDKLVSANEELSPTVLSFYKDNRSVAALPDLLHTIGMTKHDRDSVLSMLMDVSGTTKRVNSALDILKDLNFFECENEIMNATEKVSMAFDILKKSLNGFQNEQMDRKGYAFLEKDQLSQLYKNQGVDNHFNASEFGDYFHLSHEERELSLWGTVQHIALNKTSTDSEHKRSKRFTQLIAGIPVTFWEPSILAPVFFAPALNPSVGGILILAPTLFSPVILGPYIFGPRILSPGVGIPHIVSPYILGSFIGSPFVMIPFIVNPWAFGPNIMNPFVLSPIILSPTLFSPDILAPAVLGGGILSPSAGSPAVFTDSALMISVLSPTFLS